MPTLPRVYLITVMFIALTALIAVPPSPPSHAQSTGDSLNVSSSPTRRPTSKSPPAQPTATPVPSEKVWAGRLVNNQPAFTKGAGSVFRVSVMGVTDTRIELVSDGGGVLITSMSGSKPEYGPYATEFAPVTEGSWTVSVPEFGVSLQVRADGYNLAEIEFAQVEAESLAADKPAAAPTASTGPIWQGKVTAENGGIGASWGRLIVRVPNGAGQAVRLSTLAETIANGVTGQKKELGDNGVEFAALTPARYIIEPQGIEARFEVDIKANMETVVEFEAAPPPPTATPTNTATRPPLATFTRTATPLPSSTATETTTPLPPPAPTPITRWLGLIETRQFQTGGPTNMAVQVVGIEGLPVQLSRQTVSGSIIKEQRCLTGQNKTLPDSCRFDELRPGHYLISPERLGVSLPISISAHEQLTVLFDVQILPSGIIGWQATMQKNRNGVEPTSHMDSTITARVEGRQGQIVQLTSANGADRVCEVVRSPLLGLACEFTNLPAGVYTVEAVNTESKIALFVDGQGEATVNFAPTASEMATQSPSLVGYGIKPNVPTSTPTQAARSVATATTPPTRVYIPPTWTPTPTSSPTLTPTATPAFAWQANIIEVKNGIAGTIAVRAAGLKDHPVVIKSGNWQSEPVLTGTKPELGEYGVEFGGTAQGEYTIALVDLAEFTFQLEADQYVLIEFRYDFITPPE